MKIRAVREALRCVRNFTKAYDDLDNAQDIARQDGQEFVVGGKESATLRRASMDLTRALAEMRKP